MRLIKIISWSKQPFDLNSVNVDRIIIADKYKNLSIVLMDLNILLVTKKAILLKCYVLSYVKWVDT